MKANVAALHEYFVSGPIPESLNLFMLEDYSFEVFMKDCPEAPEELITELACWHREVTLWISEPLEIKIWNHKSWFLRNYMK